MEKIEFDTIINWTCCARITTLENERQKKLNTTIEQDNAVELELKRLRDLRHTSADW